MAFTMKRRTHFSLFIAAIVQREPGEGEQVSVESDETLANIVDRILGNSDINNDGFIDFVEFRSTSWHSSS
uniref:(California timema) hypothetical protein n=1 Tax=Timema californicum TaxID=61474 RepID=A0A7R9J3U9_TIMCA|nr:unnamed protein product [Timema californicum]